MMAETTSNSLSEPGTDSARITQAPTAPSGIVIMAGAPEASPVRQTQTKPLPEDDAIVQMLRSGVKAQSGRQRFMLSGLDISQIEVASPTWLLPALLVATAINWSPVVNSARGRGGFHLHLTSTGGETLLGYAACGIEVASPLMMMAPVLDTLKRCLSDDVFVLDALVRTFRDWLQRHSLDHSVLDILIADEKDDV